MYRTSKPLHPTEEGKPKAISKKKFNRKLKKSKPKSVTETGSSSQEKLLGGGYRHINSRGREYGPPLYLYKTKSTSSTEVKKGKKVFTKTTTKNINVDGNVSSSKTTYTKKKVKKNKKKKS